MDATDVVAARALSDRVFPTYRFAGSHQQICEQFG